MIPAGSSHAHLGPGRSSGRGASGPAPIGQDYLGARGCQGSAAIYLDLESEADRAKLSEPELYLSQHEDKLVILDEIQRTPQLFRSLRGLIDSGRRRGRGRGDSSFWARRRSTCSSSRASRSRDAFAIWSSPRSTPARSDASGSTLSGFAGGFRKACWPLPMRRACAGAGISSAPTSSATSRSSGRASPRRRCVGSGRCSPISRAACSTPRPSPVPWRWTARRWPLPRSARRPAPRAPPLAVARQRPQTAGQVAQGLRPRQRAGARAARDRRT